MGRGQWVNLARVKPKGHPGIFNDCRESGLRFNISSKGLCFLTV